MQEKQILLYEVAGLVGIAFERVFTPRNTTQAFKSTDIRPLDFFIFINEDFALALKERPQQSTHAVRPKPSDDISTTKTVFLVSPSNLRPPHRGE